MIIEGLDELKAATEQEERASSRLGSLFSSLWDYLPFKEDNFSSRYYHQAEVVKEENYTYRLLLDPKEPTVWVNLNYTVKFDGIKSTKTGSIQVVNNTSKKKAQEVTYEEIVELIERDIKDFTEQRINNAVKLDELCDKILHIKRR